MIWIVLWHYEQFLAALVTIGVLLVSLLVIYIGLRIRNPIRRSVPAERPTVVQRLAFWLPFSVYLGWIIVATLANLMVWLDRSGWDGGPFSYNVWAVIFMIGGTVVSAIFVWRWSRSFIVERRTDSAIDSTLTLLELFRLVRASAP